MSSAHHDVTEALDAIQDGDESARERLLGAIYDELRRIARAQQARNNHATLNTTALVHEAYVKLLGPGRGGFDDRAHFFASAARAMRQVVMDYAQAQSRQKRGGNQRDGSLDTLAVLPADPSAITPERAAGLLDLNTALERLAKLDERQVQVVECRYFVGLSVEETAEALGISTATVKRDWRMARAWLYTELQGS
ncbi:MAG: sigma-70 family RNA polymerase sigma factor [Bacteroidota bacterium]